jgi:predicted nucleic acid-binding protein
MPVTAGYPVDTHVLLRLSRLNDPMQKPVRSALDKLDRQGAELYFSMQNIAEFRDAIQGHAEPNGFGLSIAEADPYVLEIEQVMTYLHDSEQGFSLWRELAIAHKVRGEHVHDARLAAIMIAHGVPRNLTLNQADFPRCAGIEAVSPSQVQAAGLGA